MIVWDVLSQLTTFFNVAVRRHSGGQTNCPYRLFQTTRNTTTFGYDAACTWSSLADAHCLAPLVDAMAHGQAFHTYL